MNRAHAEALVRAAYAAGEERERWWRADPTTRGVQPGGVDAWLATLPPGALPGADEVFVVVTPPGILFAGYYDRDRAKGAAKAMNGTVSPLPISHDYRTEETDE